MLLPKKKDCPSAKPHKRDTKIGYGKTLFRDALRRALAGADAIGGGAFLVHAKDEEARAFYLRFGMEESPTNPLHLLLLFKDIRRSLEAATQGHGKS